MNCNPTTSSDPRRRRPRRGHAWRRGSVMIMVVALLVLLAVMGTAYLASSRGDRITSIQSQANQQTEHSINGVISSLQQMLLDDIHGTFQTPAPHADDAN